jgi:hypothetical protein
VVQVYFLPHPISTRDKADWWFVIKTKARGILQDEQLDNFAYQENFVGQNCGHISIDLDPPITLLDTD